MKHYAIACALLLASANTLAVPEIDTPTGLEVMAVSETEITIGWDNPQENIESFDIYRDSTFLNSVSGANAGAGYTDTGLTAGVAYSYSIAACDVNRICSELTNSETARTFGGVDPGGQCGFEYVPGPVTIEVTENGATLNWQPLQGIDGYLIHVNGEYFENGGHPNNPPLDIEFYSADDVYQISAYSNGEYFGKSEPATIGEPQDDPVELTQALADLAQCNTDKDALQVTYDDLLVENSFLVLDVANAEADLLACQTNGGASQQDLDDANALIDILEATGLVDEQLISDLEDQVVLDIEEISALEDQAVLDAQTIADLQAQTVTDAATIASLEAIVAQLTSDLAACEAIPAAQ